MTAISGCPCETLHKTDDSGFFDLRVGIQQEHIVSTRLQSAVDCHVVATGVAKVGLVAHNL